MSTTQREKINVPLLLSKACSKLSRQNNGRIKCKASSKVAQRQAYCCLTIDCVDLQFYRHRLEIGSKLTWTTKITWALKWKSPFPELWTCKDVSQKGTFCKVSESKESCMISRSTPDLSHCENYQMTQSFRLRCLSISKLQRKSYKASTTNTLRSFWKAVLESYPIFPPVLAFVTAVIFNRSFTV